LYEHGPKGDAEGLNLAVLKDVDSLIGTGGGAVIEERSPPV